MRKAFTLIEVNLAMLIMAGGILSIVGLYAFGFRENRQSREDVAGAAVADAIISPLVMAISHPKVRWDTFRGEFVFPPESWRSYLDGNYQVTDDPTTQAKSAFNAVMGRMSGADDVDTSFPEAALNASHLKCALVIRHEEESAVVSIALRLTDNPGQLMSQPLYYTEVRYQGFRDGIPEVQK